MNTMVIDVPYDCTRFRLSVFPVTVKAKTSQAQ